MKKIHRFLVTEIPNGPSITIEGKDLVHLIKNVLKLSVGETCIVFADGSDDYISSIKSIEKDSIVLTVQSISPKKNIPKKITACVSITKRDSFELIVQKLTELGIQNIVPIISDRTVKQALRIDRLQKISDEALEQSGGSKRVIISEPESLEKSLSSRKNISKCYFDIEGGIYKKMTDIESAFYIGPEGGWSEEDKKMFEEYSVNSYKLGETVLRAETAAIVCGYKLLWD